MKRMVTRTIEMHTYTVRTMNVETCEVLDVDYSTGTRYKTGDILNELRALHETEMLKLVAIINHTKETKLYGMDEQEFIKNAVILQPRGKTTVESDAD